MPTQDRSIKMERGQYGLNDCEIGRYHWAQIAVKGTGGVAWSRRATVIRDGMDTGIEVAVDPLRDMPHVSSCAGG